MWGVVVFLFKSFWKSLVLASAIAGILLLPFDLEEIPKKYGYTEGAAVPVWLNQETLLYILLAVAGAWVFWIDVRPFVLGRVRIRSGQKLTQADDPKELTEQEKHAAQVQKWRDMLARTSKIVYEEEKDPSKVLPADPDYLTLEPYLERYLINFVRAKRYGDARAFAVHPDHFIHDMSYEDHVFKRLNEAVSDIERKWVLVDIPKS